MQHAPGREGKRARDQYSAKIQSKHGTAMRSNISAAGGNIGDWHVQKCEKAKGMDEAEMTQKARSHFRWHGERDERGPQHEHHIDLSEQFMGGGAFAPEQLEGTDGERWYDCCQMIEVQIYPNSSSHIL